MWENTQKRKINICVMMNCNSVSKREKGYQIDEMQRYFTNMNRQTDSQYTDRHHLLQTRVRNQTHSIV